MGEYVTLDRTVNSLLLKQKVTAATVTATFCYFLTNIILKNVKVSCNRPRWPKGFPVG